MKIHLKANTYALAATEYGPTYLGISTSSSIPRPTTGISPHSTRHCNRFLVCFLLSESNSKCLTFALGSLQLPVQRARQLLPPSSSRSVQGELAALVHVYVYTQCPLAPSAPQGLSISLSLPRSHITAVTRSHHGEHSAHARPKSRRASRHPCRKKAWPSRALSVSRSPCHSLRVTASLAQDSTVHARCSHPLAAHTLSLLTPSPGCSSPVPPSSADATICASTRGAPAITGRCSGGRGCEDDEAGRWVDEIRRRPLSLSWLPLSSPPVALLPLAALRRSATLCRL